MTASVANAATVKVQLNADSCTATTSTFVHCNNTHTTCDAPSALTILMSILRHHDFGVNALMFLTSSTGINGSVQVRVPYIQCCLTGQDTKGGFAPGPNADMAAHRRGTTGPTFRSAALSWDAGSIDHPRSMAARSIVNRFPVSCGGGGVEESTPRLGMRPKTPDHTCTIRH